MNALEHMTDPALLVLEDTADEGDCLRATLKRRYAQDYEVICEGSAAAALDRLTQLAAAARPVAIVAAPATMLDTGGGDLLAMARRLCPAAKRVLIVPRGGPSAPSLRVPAQLLQDPSVAQPVLRAMTLGAIDTYLPSPHPGRDESFHLAISELLEDWARDNAPGQPAVQIVGEPNSARAHELRDILGRNGIPYEFCTAESAPGHMLLEEFGQSGSALPVVITNTGHTLADPTTEQLAAAFGMAALPTGTVDVAILLAPVPPDCPPPSTRIRGTVHAPARA